MLIGYARVSTTDRETPAAAAAALSVWPAAFPAITACLCALVSLTGIVVLPPYSYLR